MSQSTQSPEDQVLSLPDFSAIAPEDQVAPRPPWWRRRRGIITIILIALLILAGFLAYFLYLGRQRPITYQFQQATQGNFSLTVSATGPLQSAIYNLVFTGTGTISEIDVSVGQTVTKGQVLAKLNKTSLQDAVNTAQAGVLSAQTGVNTAQANLSKAQAQSNANVLSAQVTLNNAQASLGSTQTQSAASNSAAQTTLSNAQTNLTNTQTQSAASNSAAQTTLSNAQTSLSHTQTQSAANNSAAQTTLSNAQTSLSHTQAEQAALIAAAQTTLSNDQINLSNTQATASAQITGAKATEQLAIAACGTDTTCIQNATNTYNAAVAQANASVATAQAAVNTAQSQLTLTETQSTSNNAAAQATVNSAQKSATSTMATSTSNNATAQNTVNTAQKQLTVTETQSTSSNAAAQATVTSAQQSVTTTAAQANLNNTTAQNTVNADTSSLATAQANANASVTTQQGLVKTAQSTLQTNLVALQTAKHNLANATLLAPHDGIVTTINGTVGGTPGAPASASTATSATTTSSASGNTFIQIADVSTLQVLAAVNESDTANLKVGEPAQFTVSAYGNRLFTGIVSAISPVGQTVSNVVSYPVTIDVNKDDLQNANLLPGMTASVTIVVVQRPNVVLIPVNAINFARTATGTVNGIPPIITTQQASAALAQARQMRTELINQNPSVVQDNPVPAYVIEQPAGRTAFITVPVVLGLTDDTYYVVLQGLSPGDIVVVGAQRG